MLWRTALKIHSISLLFLLSLFAVPGHSLCLGEEAMTLRDTQGRKIGRMMESSRGVEARDCRGNLAGWYDPRLNQTRNSKGLLLGEGFLLPRLLLDCP